MTSPAITRDPEDERVIARLMELGATDEEILAVIAQRKQRRVAQAPAPRPESPIPFRAPPPGMPASPEPATPQDLLGGSDQVQQFSGQEYKNLATGIGQGLKVGAKNTLDLLRLAGGGPAAAMNLATERVVSPRAAPQTENIAQRVGQMGGQMLGELPAYALGGAAARGVGATLGAGVKNPFLKAILTRYVDGAGFWKNTAAAVPTNIAEGLAVEFALHPETVNTPENILRTALYSMTGSLFDGYAGAKLTQQAIRTATTEAQARAARDAFDETVKRTNELLAEQAAAPMPSALDIGMQQEGKIGMTEAQRRAVLRGEGGGDLPTATQAANIKLSAIDEEVQKAIQAEADRRIEELKNIEAPKPEESLLIRPKKPVKEVLDPIQEAYNRGMKARIDGFLKMQTRRPIEAEMTFMVDPGESSTLNMGGRTSDQINMGAGLIVDKDGLPMIGPDPNRALMTAEELQSYADILSTFQVGANAAKAKRIETMRMRLDYLSTLMTKQGVERSIETQRKYLKQLSDDFYELLELPGALDKRVGPFGITPKRQLTEAEQALFNLKGRKPPKEAKPRKRVEFGDVAGRPTEDDLMLRDAEAAMNLGTLDNPLIPQPRFNAVGVVQEIPVAGEATVVIPPPDPIPAAGQNNGPPITSASVVDPTYAAVVRKINEDLMSPPGGKRPVPLLERMKDWPQHVRQHLQDRFIPIRGLLQETYDVLSSSGATRRAAQLALKNDGGMLLPKLEADGSWRGAMEDTPVQALPLDKIMNTAGTRLNELTALLVAKRTLAQENIATGMTIGEAKTVIAATADDVFLNQLATEYRKTTDFMLDYAVRLGRLDSGIAAKWKTLEYVPLPREFNVNRWHKFYDKRTGSTRQIRNIWELTSEQMFATIERSQRNYAMSRLADQARLDPERFKDIMAPVPGEIGDKVFEKEINSFLATGATEQEARELVEQMYAGALDQTDKTVVVFHKGIPQKYRVNEPLRVAIEAMNPMELSVLSYAMSLISRPIRFTTGAALDLSFMGPLSDIVVASAKAGSPADAVKTIGNTLKGAWQIFTTTPIGARLGLTPNAEYMRAVNAGLGFGGRFVADVPSTYTPKTLGAQRVVRTVEKTYDNMGDAFESVLTPLNNAARLGLYLTHLNKGLTPQQAAAASNKALGNWNTIGASMRGWSLITEFGNVGIQSAVAAAETFKKMGINPRNITNPKKFLEDISESSAATAGFLTVGIGGVTLPTLYFLYASKDDEKINALRKANNYDYYYWREPNGEIGRARKLGWWITPMFGSSIEAMLDGFGKEERDRLITSFINNFTFNPIPIQIQTGLGLAFDVRNPMSAIMPGGADAIPIVPRGQRDVIPEAQGGPETSGLASAVASTGIASPYKVDYLLDQMLGVDGAALVRYVTGGAAGTESRVPILGRFDVRPGQQTEGSIKFYDDLEKSRKFENTVKELQLKGDEMKLKAYMEENKQYAGLYPRLLGMAEKVGKVNALLRYIAADPVMTKEGKINATKEYKAMLDEVFREYAKARKEMVQ